MMILAACPHFLLFRITCPKPTISPFFSRQKELPGENPISLANESGVIGKLTAGPAQRLHSTSSGIHDIITGRSSVVAERRHIVVINPFRLNERNKHYIER
jgi:hypothetical protein